MSALDALQANLGYSFQDEGLLRLALTHPSVVHEVPGPTPHNQRLEFLGDAVLSLVLTQELYEKFLNVSEGPLTKARAKLVNRRTLAEHGRHLGLGKHLILSRGEELHGGRERISALADSFEALLGAIFLDGGFDAAREFARDKRFTGRAKRHTLRCAACIATCNFTRRSRARPPLNQSSF